MTLGVVTKSPPTPPAPAPPGDPPELRPFSEPARKLAGVLIVVGLGALAVYALAQPAAPAHATPRPAGAEIAEPAHAKAPERHPVRIRQPIVAPRVATGQQDAVGRPITVACGTCHATTPPRIQTRSGADLDEFHQGLEYAHGQLTCLSCHDAGNYDQLRLADGSPVGFPDAIALCAQCHGPQYRDYIHGSHGGMTGHWDLTRGPRERNHCVDCHDPHSPRFPMVLPSFAPAPDRGLFRSPHSP